MKQCANLPVGINNVRSTVISGKVYCGGTTNNDDDAFFVYCYDISQGEWTTLLPLPVKWFGLGQVNGKLVAVGGRKKSNYDETNEVHTYDKRSQKWKQTIPPMSTARWSAGVLSLQSALVVAGGRTSYYTSAVEIFKPDTSQWYRTDPLPTACVHIALVALGNTLYALGGYKDLSPLNQALSASVDDLLGNALPANQTAQSGSSDTQSAWKSLPDTPTYGPAAAVFAGNLLAVGGYKEAPLDLVVSPGIKEIYMYSPSTNSWIYISDLPAPRSRTTVSVLSSTEVLVIGGWADDRVNTVYKGTLTVS